MSTVAIAYGVFATALRPANTTEAELYAPAAGVEFIGTLIVNNQDTAARVYHVAITSDSGAAGAAEWIYGDGTNGHAISAQTTHRIPITLKNAQTIRVIAGTANVIAFQLNGMTKTTT